METAVSAILTSIIVLVGVGCYAIAFHIYDTSIGIYFICNAAGTFLIAIPVAEYWYKLIKSKI